MVNQKDANARMDALDQQSQMESSLGSMKSQQYVGELLLSLMGERSQIFQLNHDEVLVAPSTSSWHLLPPCLALDLDKTAEMVNNILKIEEWKGTVSCNDDSIKRAFVESLCEPYDAFMNSVDAMRMQHISQTVEISLECLMEFVVQWRERIYLIFSLASKTNQSNGVALMNLTFKEWLMHCVADWSYNVLENILSRTSAAFHELATQWMLEGKLSPGIWMIENVTLSTDKNTHDASSQGSLSTTYDLLRTPFKKDARNMTSFMRINHNAVPFSLSGSSYLVNKIFEIGKNVLLLKKFRDQHAYDYKVQERAAILETDLDKRKLWYDLRERGHLHFVVERLYDIMAQDVMEEMMIRQKLMDHIAFVQNYFLLLRGDFTGPLQEAVSEYSKKGVSRIGNRLKVEAKAEACISTALRCIDPVKPFQSLLRYLTAAPAPIQKIPLNSAPKKVLDSATKGRDDSHSRFVGDLLRMDYKPPDAIKPVFSHVLRTYTRLFLKISPALFVLKRIDDIALRLNRISKQAFRLADKDLQNVSRFMSCILLKIRMFTTRVLGRIFEEILSSQYLRFWEAVRSGVDLMPLIQLHEEFVKRLDSLIPKPNYIVNLRRALNITEELLATTEENGIPANFVDQSQRLNKYARIVCEAEESLFQNTV